MILALIKTLRIYQWPKNLVVFAALVFAQKVHVIEKDVQSLCAFFLLCAASSAVYIFNDIVDIKKDRAHPDKCRRPLASGALSVHVAVAALVALIAVAIGGAYALRIEFGLAVTVYTVLMTAYTLVLKRVMLLDVLTVSVGFVIRAIAGALAIDVVFSNWLVVCTLFLALFLILGKRRRELELMDEKAVEHREVLGQYTTQLVDALMLIVAATTLLAYAIYTCSPEVVLRLGTDKLYITLPFVVYGLFRYLYLVYHRESGGDPSKTFLEDVPTLVAVALWGATSLVILYAHRV